MNRFMTVFVLPSLIGAAIGFVYAKIAVAIAAAYGTAVAIVVTVLGMFATFYALDRALAEMRNRDAENVFKQFANLSTRVRSAVERKGQMH